MARPPKLENYPVTYTSLFHQAFFSGITLNFNTARAAEAQRQRFYEYRRSLLRYFDRDEQTTLTALWSLGLQFQIEGNALRVNYRDSLDSLLVIREALNDTKANSP